MVAKIEQFQGKYRWLSNFTLVDINYKGVIYPSIEHAYCSTKSNDPGWVETCSDSTISSGKIKRLSKDVTLIDGWDNNKVKIMTELLKIKYSQEPFKSKLIETNPMVIEEGNLWGDKYWGICMKTNEGLNTLGKIIMKIRGVLILHSYKKTC